MERGKTKYAGVTYREKPRLTGQGTERCYYIRYYRNKKRIEEPVGRESEGMTAAKANQIRALRAAGKELSNAEARAEIAAQKNPAGGPWTVKRAWEAYRETIKDRPVMRMDTFLIPYFGNLLDRQIVTLTTKDFDDLSRTLAKTPTAHRPEKMLSTQTVKHVLALLKRILRFADRQGYCPFPAGLHITLPRLDNEKTETMTREQLHRYLEALAEEPDQTAAAYLHICLLTGIRKTALLSLKWEDINHEMKTITLRGETAKKRKTDYIVLHPDVEKILESIPRTDSPYVFPGNHNGRRGGFTRVARRVRDKAGLPPDFRPIHGLRHTFATMLASSGEVDLYTIQKSLTHENPHTTQRYAHLTAEALQRAANVMANIVKGS